MARIAVFNQKGGVGKTTIAHNLAAGLSRRGRHLLLLDLDPQSHLTSLVGVGSERSDATLFRYFSDRTPLSRLQRTVDGVGYMIPGHAELMKIDSMLGKGPSALTLLKQGLDNLEREAGRRTTIMDVCPFLGVLSLNAVLASDWVLIPIAADYLSVRGALQAEVTLNALEPVFKRRIERRYVINRFDRRRKMSFDIRVQLFEELGSRLCETAISEGVAIAEAPASNTDVFSSSPGSRSAGELNLLLDELAAAGLLD